MKGIIRSLVPDTTITPVSPVSKNPSTRPSTAPVASTTSRPTRSTRYNCPSSASPNAPRGIATSAPRILSAASRSSQPANFATGPFECTAKSSRDICSHPSRVCSTQRSKRARPPGDSVNGFTLSQPCTPKAPTTRPITTSCDSSPSNGAASLRGLGGLRFGRLLGLLGLAGGLVLATLDQLVDGVRGLRAPADPMGDAIQSQSELRLVLGGLGVVEADALDEAAIARHARVGDDDVVEGA